MNRKDDVTEAVQRQFGRSAAAYATSEIHAQGESLELLPKLLNPQSHWRMLDVATGAGHTAIKLAPFVAKVIATDITQPMLDKTAELAQQSGIENLTVQIGDAESLPFQDEAFDLVTCRLALHHFPDAPRARREFYRVLRPGGWLGFTDNFTLQPPELVEAYNRYERLRDPSHFHVPPLGEIIASFESTGFAIQQHQELSKEFEFHRWADRQQVSPENKQKLLQMMRQFPQPLTEFFRTRWTDDTMYFHLHEVVLVCQKPTD